MKVRVHTERLEKGLHPSPPGKVPAYDRCVHEPDHTQITWPLNM